MDRKYFRFTLLLFLISFCGADEKCDNILEKFANASSHFVKCAIKNSRPINLCESCMQNYTEVLDSYSELSRVFSQNKKCLDYFINLDRLQITETLFENSFNLWNEANCDSCLVSKNNQTPSLANTTLQFNKYFVDLMDCINESQKNASSMCLKCMTEYMQLNTFYITLSNKNEKARVCMDLVDRMNTTRRIWSLKCCKYRKHEEYIFFVSVGAIFLIAFLFYLLVYLCGEEKVPAILRQSRLAESLNHVNPSTSQDSSKYAIN